MTYRTVKSLSCAEVEELFKIPIRDVHAPNTVIRMLATLMEWLPHIHALDANLAYPGDDEYSDDGWEHQVQNRAAARVRRAEKDTEFWMKACSRLEEKLAQAEKVKFVLATGLIQAVEQLPPELVDVVSAVTKPDK